MHFYLIQTCLFVYLLGTMEIFRDISRAGNELTGKVDINEFLSVNVE